MDRSLRASENGVKVAKQALKLKGWTQEYLSGMAGCTRQTVSKFLAGQRIEKRIFQEICSELDLKWVELVEVETDESVDQPPNIDELVETVRINIYDSIQNKCGSMRVLDMTHPIDLNTIYTNINIIEKITGRQRLGLQELLQSFSVENFERFNLSGIQESYIPALELINKYAKLMILGKPGAGKTTFLKYVALQCIEGKFKPHLIPLFVTLKDFAESDKQLSLLEYIIQLSKSCGIESKTSENKGLWNFLLNDSMTSVEFLLRQGRFLILLDGLDEVKESDSKRYLQKIQDFSNQFAENIFVITCRIAAREYMFEKFTEVEVADFNNRQILTFVNQWFQAKNDPIKSVQFIDKLKEEVGLRELAVSPILLILLCLVFEESGSFPLNRSELYKEGLDLLLKKWDVTRNIERSNIYQSLSLKRKEDMLSQIAWDTFEKGNYFFKQKEIERYITEYIRHLPDAKMEEEALQLDSETVLKSIEAQHGLFVERARGIYSFSHLTFQEYFTARKIVTSANSDTLVQKIATYVNDKRWREILLLTVGMLHNADLLLESIKKYIDSILSQDEKIQKFLVWVEQKSCSIKSRYKLASVRAYYLNLILNLNLDHTLESSLDRAFARNRSRIREFSFRLDFYLMLTLQTDLDFTLALNRVIALSRLLTVDHIELYNSLQHMKDILPDVLFDNRGNSIDWLKANDRDWINQLRKIAIEHRNIGHDWQFSEAQEKLLKQYYDANKLLVDCLNSDCYVSREVRESIESTLLLPISSIEKLKSS
jgi:predicted NACHT family NTPase